MLQRRTLCEHGIPTDYYCCYCEAKYGEELTMDEKKMAEDAVKALVELCESKGMRDDPVVIAARATLPKEPEPKEPKKG